MAAGLRSGLVRNGLPGLVVLSVRFWVEVGVGCLGFVGWALAVCRLDLEDRW